MHHTGLPSHPLSHNCTPINGVVAIEPAGQFFRVFIRSDHGITFQDYPFAPFVLLTDPALTDTAPVAVTHHHLTGNGNLCWFTELANWHDWCLLREHLQQLNRPEAWLGIPDNCQQFLIASGITFFKGLAFNDLKFLCISIQKNDQSMIAIAATDGCSYHEVIADEYLTEAAMLERLSQIIQDQDPDVITGYQLNKHDIPDLIRSAQQHKVRLGWGRNGAVPHHQQTTQRYEIYGRSVIDIETLVHYYDRNIQPLPSTDLQQAAKCLGCLMQTDAVEDTPLITVQTTSALYQLLAPAWYQQAQLYPISYQKLLCSPELTAVHALMIREYVHQQHALPARTSFPRQIQHHGIELFQQGQAGPVIHFNLSQLPVSIMVAYGIAPPADELGVFSRLLSKTLQHSARQHGADHRFSMSAWYELLGNSHYLFSDTEAASEVNRLAHVITRDILDWLREQGATPVAVDQQGVYFVPARGHQDGCSEINTLVQRLRFILPKALNLYATGPYPSIFIYKPNQFALLQDNGEIVFRGSSFTSRSVEPFLREFLVKAVRLLLTGREHAVGQLYELFVRRLTDLSCPVTWVMRSETLADSREHYEQAVLNKKRNRAAVYELAIAETGTWRVGEKISYYVTGHSKNCVMHENCKLTTNFDPQHPDLNRPWYLERLHQLFRRLAPFLAVEEPLLFN